MHKKWYFWKWFTCNEYSSMVREVLVVKLLYHIFQSNMFEKNLVKLYQSIIFPKHVELNNSTWLRKISWNCSSQVYFPTMWYWTIPHGWQNMWNWTIPHVWQNVTYLSKFLLFYRNNIPHICTHYWNVNPMTLKMLHWKIHTSSLELKNNPKLGLRPRVGVGMDFSM